MTSKLWKDYNAKNAYDGYFTAITNLEKQNIFYQKEIT